MAGVYTTPPLPFFETFGFPQAGEPEVSSLWEVGYKDASTVGPDEIRTRQFRRTTWAEANEYVESMGIGPIEYLKSVEEKA